MPYLTKEDKERIAMGLMLYKKTLITDTSPDCGGYNHLERIETDDLAERLSLDPEYYQQGVKGI
jgi:hypothetical protein